MGVVKDLKAPIGGEVPASRWAAAEVGVGAVVFGALLVAEFVSADWVLRVALLVMVALGALVVGLALRGMPIGPVRRRRLLFALTPMLPVFVAPLFSIPDAVWGLGLAYATGAFSFEIVNWVRLGRLKRPARPIPK